MSGGRRRRLRLVGQIGLLRVRQMRSDLAVAHLSWVPPGSGRSLPIVGIGCSTTSAQMMAFGMVCLLSTMPPPGTS